MPFEITRAGRLLLACAVVGLALRLAFGFLYWTGKPLTHDEREYLSLAGSLAAGRGFVYSSPPESDTAQRFGRAPGYPAFLAAIGGVESDGTPDLARIKLAQAVIGAAGVLLIGAIAARALGPRAGVAAGGVAAVYPPLVWLPAYVFSETLFSVLALAAAFVLQVSVARTQAERSERAGSALALAAGVLTGSAILVRPVMLLFVPLALLWLLRRRHGVLILAFAAATAAVVAPWTARNYRAYGRVVLVASSGGVNFWTGNHPLAIGEGDLAANPDIKRVELEFRRAHPGLTPEQLEPLYYHDALAYIADHPGWWAGLLVRKAFYTVVPLGPSYSVHSTRYQAAAIGSYVVLLLAAAAGVPALWRSRRRPTAVLLLALSAFLGSLVFFPQERYRIPVIDPALIVCASALASRHRL